jgi:hypothetical protein
LLNNNELSQGALTILLLVAVELATFFELVALDFFELAFPSTWHSGGKGKEFKLYLCAPWQHLRRRKKNLPVPERPFGASARMPDGVCETSPGKPAIRPLSEPCEKKPT